LIIGIFKLAVLVHWLLSLLNKHLLRRKLNLIERYGTGSWAVVTGASDGIGAAYCRLLAKDGFNIVLVSRTMSKLQKVEKECRELNPKIQTRIVQADFAGNANLQFYEAIYKKVEDLDISILINNAGVMYTGRFDEKGTEKKWVDTLDVDVTHVSMMTSFFINKLLNRATGGKKSALINVSSQIGYLNGCAGAVVYCASKGYVNYFTQAVAFELRDKLDV
jgi:17beta-estradiol 17-dehydrogenase / very-long-chain 3-oxoacyl-CoA reductase